MQTKWISGGLVRSHETLNSGCPTGQLAKTHAAEVGVLLEAFPPDDETAQDARANARTLSLADALIAKARGLGVLGGAIEALVGDEEAPEGRDAAGRASALPMRSNGRGLVVSCVDAPFDANGLPASCVLTVLDLLDGKIAAQAVYAIAAPSPEHTPKPGTSLYPPVPELREGAPS